MVQVNSPSARRPESPSEAVGTGLGERALAALAVPVVVCEAGSRLVVWVNDAFVEATGIPVEEAVGRPSAELGAADEGPDGRGLLTEAMAQGRPATALTRWRRAAGPSFWARTSATPVHDAGGELTHWAMSIVDVTEHVERAAVVAAERRERATLEMVSEVSDTLMDVDDGATLLRVGHVLRRVVDWAGFYLGETRLTLADALTVEFPQRRARPGEPPDPDRDPVRLLLDGETTGPIVLRPAQADEAVGVSRELLADVAARLQTEGVAADRVTVMAVPGRDGALGVLVVVARAGSGGLLDGATRLLLQLTGRRVGLAADNVRLYAREHRLAETLQRAMLPEQAEVDGLDLWTHYAPNSDHAQVGGDWYDVLPLGEGIIGIVIGDVVGHDVEAAATMGQLRSVVRAYAYELPEPGAALDRVDQLIAGMRVPRAASLVLCLLTRDGDGWVASWSRAGHLPPVMVRGGRAETLDGAGGPLIGYGYGAGPRPTGTVRLDPGDLLVLYTDGLIERRTRDLRAGLDELVRLAGTVTAHDAAGIGEELLSGLPEAAEDDVAVVVVRVPGADEAVADTHSPRRRRWVLPNEPASVSRARHAVARTCQAWGHPSAAAELVASELTTNAVMHGWGRITLRVFDTGGGLRIEVSDANPAPPRQLDGHDGRVGGFGVQIIDRLATWGWSRSGDGKVVWATVPYADQAG